MGTRNVIWQALANGNRAIKQVMDYPREWKRRRRADKALVRCVGILKEHDDAITQMLKELTHVYVEAMVEAARCEQQKRDAQAAEAAPRESASRLRAFSVERRV